jgi:integrase
MDALSIEECRRFLAVARESEWCPQFALALTSRMRPSEHLTLKWSDIDWQGGAARAGRSRLRCPAGRPTIQSANGVVGTSSFRISYWMLWSIPGIRNSRKAASARQSMI